ncbi:MAG: pyridine nucleotide-disulfide oxidoreductase, partial [Bryobacteraceae bacterium]
MSVSSNEIDLGFGVLFDDLYNREGLVRLDGIFLHHLTGVDPSLNARLANARANPEAIAGNQRSELIIELAPHVEDFLGELFNISGEMQALGARHNALAPLFAYKRKFIQKRAISGVTKEQAASIDGPALAAELESLFGEPLTQQSFFQHVSRWIEDESEHAPLIQTAARYAAWAALSPAGIRKHHSDVLFKVAHKLDQQHLIPVESIQLNGLPTLRLSPDRWRDRQGFKLTDAGMNLTGALDQAHYCIKCHNQSKDSCSSGLKEKTGEFKKSAF